MIGIIDYDAGNIKSVEKALISLGEEVVLSRDAAVLAACDKVILPGVGAFKDAMENLERFGLIEPVRAMVKNKMPFLGICLGLQLLFQSSEESPGVEGLGLLPGEILRIPSREGVKIPHMGWNAITMNPHSRLFCGIPQESYVYFVHSYYLKAEHEADVAASVEYSTHIHAAVERDNLFACQFHPEKSGAVGLEILKNFARLQTEK